MNFHRLKIERNDFNDCTVIAISTVTGISYEIVRDALLNEGRGFGTGLRSDVLGSWLRDNKFTVQSCTNVPLKLALLRCFEGKYLFLVKGHIFAVIDGKVYDTAEPKPNERVLRIYKYENS